MAGKPLCKATKNDGSHCRAPALPGRDHCFVHDQSPDMAAKRREGRRAGARTRNTPPATLSSEVVDRLPLRTAADIVAALEVVFRATLTGALDPRAANAATYVAATSLRAIEGGELEKRLDELESALAAAVPQNGRSCRGRCG
jgi:hypothetical protein